MIRFDGGDTLNQKGDTPMTIQRSIRMDRDVYEWLEGLAKKDKRSVSDVIRLALDYAKESGWRP